MIFFFNSKEKIHQRVSLQITPLSNFFEKKRGVIWLLVEISQNNFPLGIFFGGGGQEPSFRVRGKTKDLPLVKFFLVKTPYFLRPKIFDPRP